MSDSLSRRHFLSLSALASTPLILPNSVWAAPPSERLNLGFIGMGTQNRGLLSNFLRQDGTQVMAVCDVDGNRRENAQETVEKYYNEHKPDGWKGCDAYNDFRKIIERDDIDAVVIATPDHWHAIITVAALNSGKDVYCEKPLTHNIHEAISVMNAVTSNKSVLQTGSMQRSMKEFRVACELVQNGAIGTVSHIECSFGPPARPCDLPEESMEPGLDWKMWLGPAKMRPYHSKLSPRGVHKHFPDWRSYREFGGGMVTDWGAHHLDIAQWGLGMDDSGPVKVVPPKDVEKAKNGAQLTYANGVSVVHGGTIGVRFHGAEGEVAVDRGRFAFKRHGKTVSRFLRREDGGSLERALVIAEREALTDSSKKLYKSNHHVQDFLNAVKSRTQPITHAGVGGRTAICCHLMNAAYYSGEMFYWDPAKLDFAYGTGKPEWLTRDYQAGWKV